MAKCHSPIELYLSCKNLRDTDWISKSDPFIVVFEGSRQIGRTETIKDDLNPDFSKPIRMLYEFERLQTLKFYARDCDEGGSYDDLGYIEATVGEIVCQGEVGVEKNIINGRGKMRVRAVNLESPENKTFIKIKCSAKNCDKKDGFLGFGSSDPFYEIWSGGALLLRSKTIMKNLNPVWNENLEFSKGRVQGGGIEIKVWDYDEGMANDHDLIGIAKIPDIETLSNGASYPLIHPKKKYKKKKTNSGTFHFDKLQITQKKSWLEHVQSGLRLNFSCAIDFTGSNGDPKFPQSLHYRSPQNTSPYSDALASVISIIQEYDDDKLFPCTGFGAKLPNGQYSDSFPLNLHTGQPCASLDEILHWYWECVRTIQLWGPTNFAPSINKILNELNPEGTEYQVLLIITDGVITDMPQTKRAIAAAQKLPVSIIIIGVGNADFSAMDELDSDGGDAFFSNIRDCVQFVGFNECAAKFNNRGLQRSASFVEKFHAVNEFVAAELLEELPMQVEKYMDLFKNSSSY